MGSPAPGRWQTRCLFGALADRRVCRCWVRPACLSRRRALLALQCGPRLTGQTVQGPAVPCAASSCPAPAAPWRCSAGTQDRPGFRAGTQPGGRDLRGTPLALLLPSVCVFLWNRLPLLCCFSWVSSHLIHLYIHTCIFRVYARTYIFCFTSCLSLLE